MATIEELQTEIYIVTGVLGGVLILVLIMVVLLALSITKLKENLKDRKAGIRKNNVQSQPNMYGGPDRVEDDILHSHHNPTRSADTGNINTAAAVEDDIRPRPSHATETNVNPRTKYGVDKDMRSRPSDPFEDDINPRSMQENQPRYMKPRNAADMNPRNTTDMSPRQTTDMKGRNNDDMNPRYTADMKERNTDDMNPRYTADINPRYTGTRYSDIMLREADSYLPINSSGERNWQAIPKISMQDRRNIDDPYYDHGRSPTTRSTYQTERRNNYY